MISQDAFRKTIIFNFHNKIFHFVLCYYIKKRFNQKSILKNSKIPFTIHTSSHNFPKLTM